MGQPIYVAVSASNINSGIMTLEQSGGQEEGSYWIDWDPTTGFTDQGWFYDSSYLHIGWPAFLQNNPEYEYSSDLQGFQAYMAAVNPDNLNEILGGWDNNDKWNFGVANGLITHGCMHP